MKTFDIKINNKKSKEIETLSILKRDISDAIDVVLIGVRQRDLNLAVWMNDERSYGEIITLDQEFQEEDFITIIEKKENEK